MGFSVQEFLSGVVCGEPQGKGNLTVFPLISRVEFRESLLLLDEAMEMGVLEMGEVSESGMVNTIIVKNNGDTPVLILDGEEVAGAKQNRMVNATVLVPQKSSVRVPVSCVERGRWSYESPCFIKSEVFGYATLRRQKVEQVACNLEGEMGFVADQGAIWAEVSRKQVRMGAPSGTDALHDVYESYADKLEQFISGLNPVADQAGVAVFINGRFSCLDLLASEALLRKVWDKLLKSYAMEALDVRDQKQSEEKMDCSRVLDKIRECECREYPSVGRGTDIRLRGANIVGAGLVDGGHVLHLSVFSGGTNGHTRMARPGVRRSSRRV